MRGFKSTLAGLGALLFVFSVGIGILVWLAPVPADELTPAQTNLIYLGDTMVKGAIGAILGFAGARLAMRGSSRRAMRAAA